jgi:hypothetical protein
MKRLTKQPAVAATAAALPSAGGPVTAGAPGPRAGRDAPRLGQSALEEMYGISTDTTSYGLQMPTLM